MAGMISREKKYMGRMLQTSMKNKLFNDLEIIF